MESTMSDPCSPSGDEGAASVDRNQNKQRYTCRACGAKLSRISHLHRHQLQHSSPKETFQCHLCNKEFNRKDVYQRHLRAVHDPKQASQRKGWKKSCQRCIRYKLKCSRELPCSACSRKQVPCNYDVSVSRSASQRSEQSQSPNQINQPWQAMSPRDPLLHGGADGHASTSSNFGGPGHNPSQDCVGSSRHLVEQATDFPSRQTTNGPMNGATPHIQPPSYESVQKHGIDISSEAYHGALSSGWEFQDPTTLLGQDSGCPPIDGATSQWIDGISLDLEAFDNSMFRASRMDWLGCETDFSDQHTVPPLSENAHVYPEVSPCREDLMTRTMSTRQPQPVPMDIEQHPAPSFPEKDDKTTWPGVLDHGGNEMWPFDYASNKGFRKIKLPPLREIMEQTVGLGLPDVQTSTVKDLIRVLSAPLIPSLNDSPALEALPAVAFLGQLVTTYFAEFHPALPIVHVPTWRIERCPSALLAAMACIGATYSTAEGSQEIAALLAEITQRTLFWMGQADSRSFRNPAYIAASCLHQIYALGSGNRRLYELADASRGLLVTGLRESGVLSSDAERSEASKTDFQGLKKMDAPILEQSWNRWRDIEIERRVAWSVFEFDCALSILTSKRGAFSISELPTKLPCSESLWDAPSANAWASVVSFSASPPDGIPFYPLLRNIIARNAVSESVPAWAKRICALVVSRLLWDLRELEDAASTQVLGLSSLANCHKATRENLLASLTALSNSLSRPTCTYDVINMNVACLATHFAYLNSGDDTMDLVTFIFRNNHSWTHGSSTSQLNKELARALENLRQRFQHNPVATRRSVRHAALVVGISRECTSFTPCETMRVFFSFAFLLAFARFFPFDKVPSAPRDEIISVRLDELPTQNSKPSGSVSRLKIWIEQGGPASLESVDDICLARNFNALKDTSLRAMERLRVWGLAKKFHRILKNFNYD